MNCPKRGTLSYTFLEMERKSRMNSIMQLTQIIDYYQTFIRAMEIHKPSICIEFEKQFLEDCKKAQNKLWEAESKIKCI
jgi:uncharacterized short protein YbdD (DUF466 family)